MAPHSELLHSLASRNPFIDSLLSFHSQFRIFCHQAGEATLFRFLFSLGWRGYIVSFSVLVRLERLSTQHSFAAVLPGDSVAGLVVANGVSNLYNTLLVCRLVLTWFPNSPPAIVGPLSTICDPYLNIFRGLIPPLGGTLDLSPILAFLVLNAFTSTASALPAELPGSSSPVAASRGLGVTHFTTLQKKWIARLQGSSSSNNIKS